ncbi:MAG: DUF1656 domain-containing protein [Zoogloea sp.]|nr:DUF1656 domain-containing protein [Zoogloea sp.]
MPDIVIWGVRMPFLLALIITAGALHMVFDRLFAHFGGYAHVWHPGLFRVAVFTLLFAGTGLYFFP